MENLNNKSRFDDCEIIGILVDRNLLSDEVGKAAIVIDKLPDGVRVIVTKKGLIKITFTF